MQESILDIITMFQNKGACIHTQDVAERYKKELKERLLEQEYWDLNLAHNHYLLGEGRGEFDGVCNRLKSAYQKQSQL